MTPTGRVTQYSRDEFGILFSRGTGSSRDRRVMRYSPMGSRSPETSLNQLSELQLRSYFGTSQPARTAPDTGYTR
ncbi:MAG: hypothetical protein ABI679_03730 [Gemmatimonadota bacterium]